MDFTTVLLIAMVGFAASLVIALGIGAFIRAGQGDRDDDN